MAATFVNMSAPEATVPAVRRRMADDPSPLISLEDAQMDPDIVYRSFERLSRTPAEPRPRKSKTTKFLKSLQWSTKTPKPRVWTVGPPGAQVEATPAVDRPRRVEPKMTLIPLDVAQARDDIRLREEWYEMEEERMAQLQELEDAIDLAWWL